MLRRWRRADIEALAALIAAVLALVLHLLHIVEQDVLLMVIMVILAVMLVRDFRREDRDERSTETTQHIEDMLGHLVRTTARPEVTLVGPLSIRESSSAFSRDARGEMTWFNVCLSMFEPQPLFDTLLRPALENPRVTSVRFVLDHGERERWERAVLPKARAIAAEAKLDEPIWTSLSEPVSCILAEGESSGRVEALLSFWGEPFMARTRGRDVPRYVIYVHDQSELIPHLTELVRSYRLSGP